MQRNEEGIVNAVFSQTGDAANPAFYSQGFTPAMSTPGSGQFPPRTAFNFLFKILTALAVDVNSSGCFLPWDALVNYYQNARVVGSDNKVYIATQNNGPATGNAANPATTPIPAVWQLSPENSLGTMATQNANAVAITGGTISDTNINTVLAALGTLAIQNANNISVTGGSIDDTVIGAGTPAAAAFTKAVDSGDAPTADNQLTNRKYVNGTSSFTAVPPANPDTSVSGYMKLPGGLIIQWFSFPANGGGNPVTVTLPTPWPNGFLTATGCFTSTTETGGFGCRPNSANPLTQVDCYGNAGAGNRMTVFGF